MLCCNCYLYAQSSNNKKKPAEKVVSASEKVNKTTQEISNAAAASADQIKQAGENIKSTVESVKAVVKIFEPIFSFHFKKNKKGNNLADNPTYMEQGNETTDHTGNEHAAASSSLTEENNQQVAPPPPYTPENYSVPENENYNADGTMNIGHQNSALYGNCIDLLSARVVGMGEAEENPGSIDLIFFSQFGGLGYSFESPAEAPTINEGVSVKAWRQRNETEIAETKISIAQFEKITANTQLLNAVKNTSGFKGEFYTPNKMDGRVFAAKITQDDRELYALIAVYKQYGTSGSNGYLKIKIKVQGIDANRDGYPDPGAYRR